MSIDLPVKGRLTPLYQPSMWNSWTPHIISFVTWRDIPDRGNNASLLLRSNVLNRQKNTAKLKTAPPVSAKKPVTTNTLIKFTHMMVRLPIKSYNMLKSTIKFKHFAVPGTAGTKPPYFNRRKITDEFASTGNRKRRNHQKMKNRQPPNWKPPRLCPPKQMVPTNTLIISMILRHILHRLIQPLGLR